MQTEDGGGDFVCSVRPTQGSDRHGTTVAFRSIFQMPVYTQSLGGARTYTKVARQARRKDGREPGVYHIFIYLFDPTSLGLAGRILLLLKVLPLQFPPDPLGVFRSVQGRCSRGFACSL